MKTFLTATAILLAGTSLASAEGQLQLYNWGNYTSPELLAKFEKETGIKVTVTDYDSRNDAGTQLQNAQDAITAGVDLIIISPTDSSSARATIGATDATAGSEMPSAAAYFMASRREIFPASTDFNSPSAGLVMTTPFLVVLRDRPHHGHAVVRHRPDA